jgi:hypothetical protein
MGCVCNIKPRKHNTLRRRVMTNEIIEVKRAKKNYFYATKNWLQIIDYLSYKDLVQIGKLNKYVYI